MSRIIAVGLGCRAGASGERIAALVRRALAESGAPEGRLRLFTIDAKRHEPGLVEASRLLAAPLDALSAAALRAEAPRVARSAAVEARFGVPAVAEAAALAGAGAGGRLLKPKIAADGATCAVALSAERP